MCHFKLQNPHNSYDSIIDTSFLDDDSITWLAKGLYINFLFKPHNWKFSYSDLVSLGYGDLNCVVSAVEELITSGYLKRSHLISS